MADTLTAAAPETVATPTSAGLDPGAGQAAPTSTPAPSNNPADSSATPSGQAPAPVASTPKYRFKDQTEAERAHSELQGRYTKVFGQDLEQAQREWMLWHNVKGDPKFREWAQARLAEQEAGSSDPETVKALQIVEQVATRKAQELVAPLAAQAAQARLAGVFQAMTQKHGKDWEAYKPAMAELFAKGVQAGFFSPAANQNVSLEFVDHLYTLAANADPEYAAKKYQKSLAAKQAASTQAAPGPPATAVAPASVRSIEDAFAAAKRTHGIA